MLFAAFERLAQGCSGRRGNPLLVKKIPSPACRFRVAEKVTGFCIFSKLWSAPIAAAPWIHGQIQSGVALRLAPQSKLCRSRR